jgi:hypothetical protein
MAALAALLVSPLGLSAGAAPRLLRVRVPPPISTPFVQHSGLGRPMHRPICMSVTNSSSPEPADGPKSEDTAGDALRKGAAKAGDAVFFVWTLVVNILGGLLTLGLLLNLSGFGYRYSLRPPSLEVKPLAEMRQENAERRFFARDFPGLFPEL